MSDIIVARDIEIVTAEIRTIQRETSKTVILAAMAIGERLVEAKSMLQHGEWGKWLEERVDYSQSTAENLMRLYREYGSNQESLFDNFAKSETFAKLTPTQALALLAIPAPDRQEFAEANHVTDMSTRELQAAIKAKDTALSDLRAAEAAQAQAEAAAAELDQQLKTAGSTICDLTAAAAEKEKNLEQAREKERAALREAARLESKLEAAEKAERAAKEELEQARAQENQQVPAAIMEELRKEAEAKAKAAATAAAEKEAAKAKEELRKAQEALRAAEELAEEYRNRPTPTATSTEAPDVTRFREVFAAVQREYNRLTILRETVEQHDKATAEKLKAATAAMLDSWKERLT